MAKLQIGWSEYMKPTPNNVKLIFDSAAISLVALTTTFAESVISVKLMMVGVGIMQMVSRYIGTKQVDEPLTNVETNGTGETKETENN
jgi:hypothetical protein